MSRGAQATVIGRGLQALYLASFDFFGKFAVARACYGHDHDIQ